jgi:phosphoribosylaminoimidazolecarboxamide formyltransferase/IMP cyclohydrolase
MIQEAEELPEVDGPVGKLVVELKYGENAIQSPAGRYSYGGDHPLALSKFEHVAGNPRSMVGDTDVMRAIHSLTRVIGAYDLNGQRIPKAAVGVKHGNPAGAAAGKDGSKVAELMVKGHPVAIFGGILVFNYHVDEDIARALKFTKGMAFCGIYAPSISPEAVEILSRKDGLCCIEVNPALGCLDATSMDRTIQRVPLGYNEYILQPRSTFVITPEIEGFTVHREGRVLSLIELLALAFGAALTANTVSNTIMLVRYDDEGNVYLIGTGAGQMDRVGASELAIKRANDSGHSVKGAIAISDSFFPATDGPEVLIAAGVTIIYATLGSKMDDAVIAVCAAAGVLLVTLPDRVGRLFSNHIGG